MSLFACSLGFSCISDKLSAAPEGTKTTKRKAESAIGHADAIKKRTRVKTTKMGGPGAVGGTGIP